MTMMYSAGDLIEQRLGLATGSQRAADLQQLISELSNGSSRALLNVLRESDDQHTAWQDLIQRLAIGETYFFRDQAHFDLLRTRILPPLIQQRREHGELVLSLGSIGCATGEEPYSLAILLYELLPDIDRWMIRLHGMDINLKALEAARRGVYRPWSFRMADHLLNPYFDRTPEGLRLKAHIRAMVTFRPLNLVKAVPLPQYDVLLCRNVLLYFTPSRAAAAEAVLNEMLYPGGWLFLAQSEALRDKRHGWTTHLFPGAPAYQKALRREEAEIREHRLEPIVEKRTQPVPDSESDYQAAVSARHAGQPAEAQRQLIALLADQPNHAPAHALMACLYADQKRIPEAHVHLDTALHLEPLMADAYYVRGLLHYERGDHESARQALQHALYCQRTHPLASFMLGTLLARSGGIPRALKLWQSALQVISTLDAERPISDLSDITARQLEGMIAEQLAGWS
jgi:chemotaxis protein methyltransferase CheR